MKTMISQTPCAMPCLEMMFYPSSLLLKSIRKLSLVCTARRTRLECLFFRVSAHGSPNKLKIFHGMFMLPSCLSPFLFDKPVLPGVDGLFVEHLVASRLQPTPARAIYQIIPLMPPSTEMRFNCLIVVVVFGQIGLKG